MNALSFFSHGSLLALVLNALLTSACAQSPDASAAPPTPGNPQAARNLQPFTSLAIAGPWRVEIKLGDEHSLQLVGNPEAFKRLEVEQRDNGLSLKMKSSPVEFSWRDEEQGLIIVTTQALEALAVSGSGDVVMKSTLNARSFELGISGSADVELPVNVKTLKVGISGSSDVVLSGTTDDLDVGVSGSGDLRATALAARRARVGVSGSGDVQLNVTEELLAGVSGSGNIRYRGNPPKVNGKASGSGDIKAF